MSIKQHETFKFQKTCFSLSENQYKPILKENPCIPQKFLPNYNSIETPEEKETMQNLTIKRYVPNSDYERQLESIKQIDSEMTNLIKSYFDDKIAIILHEQWAKQCKTVKLHTRAFKEKTMV